MFPADREAVDCLTCEVPVLTNASPSPLQKEFQMNFSRLRSSAWNVTRDERRNEKRERRTFSHNLRGDKTPISIRSISISISGPRVSAPATLCHPVSKYRWLGTYLALWWDDGTTCLGRKLLKTHTMRRSAACWYWSYRTSAGAFNFVMYPVSSTQLIILHFVMQ